MYAAVAAAQVVFFRRVGDIWPHDLNTAHNAAQRVAVGLVWVNEVARHFLGSPFYGYRHSGLKREECLDDLLAFTQEKNIHIRIRPDRWQSGP